MIDWISDTSDIAIVSLENSGTKGSEVVDGKPFFRADLYVGMRNGGEVEKYFDSVATYLPAANTIRMPINAKSLQPDVPGSDIVGRAIETAAKRGYGIILVYTDPIFLGSHRKPYSAEYYENNVSVLTGQPIELDAEVASGSNPNAILAWGRQSPEYDPVDDLVAGWGSVLDWIEARPEIRAKIRGYELLNEPGRAYTAANNPEQMRAYASAMTEVYTAHAPRWTAGASKPPVSVLVNIAGGGSGRVGALDQTARGEPDSALDLIRQTIGAPLVWSVHTFTDTSLAEFSAPDSSTKLYQLASNNILVTETQFDGDFQLLGNKSPEAKALAARYGVPAPAGDAPLEATDFYADGKAILAPWMGWELLDPIMGSRNYFGAREKLWYGKNGIGSGYWTPVGFDASMFVGYSGKNIEISRDITAFANAMWLAGSPPRTATATDGACGGDATLCITPEAVKIRGNPHLSPMIGIGDDGADRVLGADSPESEGGLRFFRQSGREQSCGQVEEASTFPANGDMAYGLTGNDLLDLRGGDDFGFGGAGDDSLLGGTGHDVLLGDDGADSIDGGPGDDVIEGGAGNDTLTGGDGTDLIKGDAGDDVMTGSAGVDYFYLDAAGDGNDTINGFEWGVDRLFIGNSTDFGGTGNRRMTEMDNTVPRSSLAYAAGGRVTFAP